MIVFYFLLASVIRWWPCLGTVWTNWSQYLCFNPGTYSISLFHWTAKLWRSKHTDTGCQAVGRDTYPPPPQGIHKVIVQCLFHLGTGAVLSHLILDNTLHNIISFVESYVVTVVQLFLLSLLLILTTLLSHDPNDSLSKWFPTIFSWHQFSPS